MIISDEAKKFLSKKRFYVFFPDGTWRTCEEGQWKEEQVYKLPVDRTGWFELSEFDIRVIQAVTDRYSQ